ncbi:acetate--CoA ligase family protein [Paraburkholderia sp. BL25I1N1]|uniref:acetate--CoA ligase family protein n=1 Tax=Paraburkholderia sp. BL25I1N1 TaxID=1938804 RepID=UPI000D471071|nr:acetate--CoA ligase family protein [Paraburkholderia sp. BL25I1N1]PRY03398.1 acyl-CoA synthetase (NDP forming) [Paraburkholderia sp. BL25I1N1]
MKYQRGLDIERLVAPRSIAIIGASNDPKSISGQPLRFLLQHGYRGVLYPVNPKYAHIEGVACHPAVASLPQTPDLALILVAARRVPAMLRECGEKGIRHVIVYSSGFAEAGEAGAALQREIADVACAFGIRVIGPNCQGVVSTGANVYAGFGAPFGVDYRAGGLSLISQSGGFGCALLLMADDLGIGLRHFITTGNEADVSLLDLVDACIDDEKTSLIAAYIEGLKDARRLVSVATRALDAGKPLLAWKVGNTADGAKAAASHTANLGGASALYRTAFRQAGVIEVTDVADLGDYAKAFEAKRLPRGNRIAVVTLSGGAGILITDACSEHGMTVPPLSPATLDALRPIVPAFASLANPVDLTAGILAEPQIFTDALQIIANDPGIDSIAIMAAAASGEVALAMAEAIVRMHRATDKPLMLAWNARREMAADAYRVIETAGVPLYATPVRCGRAFAVLADYAQARRTRAAARAGRAPACDGLRADMARALVAQSPTELTEHAAQRLLEHYGIGTPKGALVKSRDEACTFARTVGFPLVVKVQSPDIPHKTEAGAVRVGIRDEAMLSNAFDEIVANARRHVPGARIDGVLVQEEIRDAVEMIVGIDNDPSFGPAVMCGLGGIYAEVLKDVAWRLAPVTRTEACAMIRELQAFAMLDGARGKPHCDVDALADAIVAMSAMALDLAPGLKEFDINPLFVLPAGKGVRAGDAFARCEPRPASKREAEPRAQAIIDG